MGARGSEQAREQLAAEPAALPVVGEHDRELCLAGRGFVLDIARDADLVLLALHHCGGDERHLARVVDVGEALELSERQASRGHQPLIAGRGR